MDYGARYMFDQDKEDDMKTYSGSYADSVGGDQSEDTPKAAGVIAEWGVVNRKLRHHGFQPVMVLPSNQLQHIPRGAVVLDDSTSKNVRHTLDKLMTDCDRRQSMLQQLISSSHRIQKDADEERNRASHHEMEMRKLQRELDEEKIKAQEMERMRLLELQIHGKEVSELRRNKSEVLALCKQLEQKVAQKDVEIIRLHQQCQDLVQMEERDLKRQTKVTKHFKSNAVDQKFVDENENLERHLGKFQRNVDHPLKKRNLSPVASNSDIESGITQSENSATVNTVSGDSLPTSNERGLEKDQLNDPKTDVMQNMKEVRVMEDKYLSAEKQLKDLKKLIRLLESENTHLKMELETRPNREEWKDSRKYNRQLEKLLAQNNLSPPPKKQIQKQSLDGGGMMSGPRRYTTHIDDIDYLPIDVSRKYLKEVCNGLQVSDLKHLADKISSMESFAQSHPAMEKLIEDVMDVVFSDDSPKFTDEVMSHSEHELHCERAWLNLVPELRMWLRELSELKDLQASVRQLSLHLMPWKSENAFTQDGPVTVQNIKREVDGLSEQKRASPFEIRTFEEPSVDQLKCIIAHFQKLFDVNSMEGIFPRMNEVYMRLGESNNLMNNLRDTLGLGPGSKSSDVVNSVAKLSKAKHLLDVEDLPGIIKRLDQYDEFYPAFQSLVSELKRLLRVQEMDEILTAVTALVKFPHY